MSSQAASPEATIPVACNLPEDKLAERGEDIATNLFAACTGVRELDDGYAFSFPAEEQWASRLLEFVLEERKCCPFFEFDILFEPAGGPIHLHLSGGAGVKGFVRENFLSGK